MDELIKEFEERAKEVESKYAKKYAGTEYDEMYDVDIHIWRHQGMGNSLQTIQGNKLSIMTAMTSLLHTLLIKNVLNESEVKYMIEMSLIGVERNGKN